MSQTAKRLAELRVALPKPVAPVADCVPYVRTGGVSRWAPAQPVAHLPTDALADAEAPREISS